MSTRRDFLGAVAAGIGASTAFPASALASAKAEIKTTLNGPVGLQLWSLREYLPKDLAGTLARVRAFGFREVEGAGLWGRSLAELKAALDAAGLRCTSAHMGFERLRDDLPGALAEAKALGSTGSSVRGFPTTRNSRERTLCARPRPSTVSARARVTRAFGSATTATATSSCLRPRGRYGTPWLGPRIPPRWRSRWTSSTPTTAGRISCRSSRSSRAGSRPCTSRT